MLTWEIKERFKSYRLAGLPDNTQLEEHANKLLVRHAKKKLSPRKNPDREFMAALGQRRLAYLTGGKMDMVIRPGEHQGDDHIDQQLDFKGGLRFPADVKIANNPFELIVWVEDMNDILARHPGQRWIFILGGLLNHKDEESGEKTPRSEWDAELQCWEWDTNLRKSIPKTHHEMGLLNYWVPNPFHPCYKGAPNPARDIYELLAKVERNWERA